MIAHNKPSNHASWDYRREDGYGIGVSMEHFRCQKYASACSHKVKVTDTLEFWH